MNKEIGTSKGSGLDARPFEVNETTSLRLAPHDEILERGVAAKLLEVIFAW